MTLARHANVSAKCKMVMNNSKNLRAVKAKMNAK